MAYVYLLDLHIYIDRRLTEARRSADKAEISPDERRFHEGRIDSLSEIKDFLTENLNPKLPRRIRENYFKKT